MAASSDDIENFLSGPLVKWLSTCVKKPELLLVYETFFDGSPIKEVLLLIDPEPSQLSPILNSSQELNVTVSRIKVFYCIFQSIKSIYEELGQIVISVPDFITLGSNPRSQIALKHLETIILLLLGCAVQGPTKQLFITKIKELSLEEQHSIVECIKKITDGQNIVLSLDDNDHPQKLLSHLKAITEQNDKILHQWITNISQESTGTLLLSHGVESNHLAVELADWKARLRKLRQELEEKSELLVECQDELKHTTSQLSKLKSENLDLLTEARQAKIYRDEVDSMRERLERAERLELEIQRYRERVADAEFYKTRVEELREDNKILHETREILESQIAKARLRSDRVLELEAELLASKQVINDISLERDAARNRVQELLDENVRLQQEAKAVVQDILEKNSVHGHEMNDSKENILSEQLTNTAQAKSLRLELENKRLLSTIDYLKESNLQDNAGKIFDIKKENKQLILKCEQLQDNVERLSKQKSEMEHLLGNALQENQKLQETLRTEKLFHNRQNSEYHSERNTISELENNIELLTAEKQKLNLLCDTLKQKLDDTGKSLEQISDQLEAHQIDAGKAKEYETLSMDMQKKMVTLEKENSALQREIIKLKEIIEVKDVKLDELLEKNNNIEKDITSLTDEKKSLIKQVEKLQDYEQNYQEVASQLCISREAIETLQKDLIDEKLCNEKIKGNIEKLGLTCQILESSSTIILEQMMNNPEILHNILNIFEKESIVQAEGINSIVTECLECKKLQFETMNLQAVNNSLQNENITLKVDSSTLKSQLNSFQSQQTALQLANSQLVAEKDELIKKTQMQTSQHDTLLSDQIMLRSLHEQLTLEYEESRREHEQQKKIARDLRSEMRIMLEDKNSLENKLLSLEAEKEALQNTTRNLINLRSEHSKLKEDFRNLFTASERLKQEYEVLNNEFKSLKIESRTLRLGQTEMQGELNSRSDKMASLQLENTKLQQKCDMLFDMNHSLELDRKTLMEHVSQLLSQYHSLLTHSLQDKEYFHTEEKLYTDKLNHLCKQKEKLEEKIMEHYKKLENTSTKKKSFGANLVKKVRKASTDMFKVPKSRKSWHADTICSTQSRFTSSGDSSNESTVSNSDNSIHEIECQSKPLEEELRRIVVNKEESKSFKKQEESVSLGSVGSRRTVYLSDENTSVVGATSNNNQTVTNNLPTIIYNRISTAIGEIPSSIDQQPELQEELPNTNTLRKSRVSKESAVWYEYGCV